MKHQTELARVMSFLGSRKTQRKKDSSRANLAKANAARMAKKQEQALRSTGKPTN